ncbi:MAG: PorV/PorQ family protein [candidate division Zixibacteria bacterium]|nr:PorV/PorQ family protein [candidate division Zixibacteria bacterium]
MFKISISTILLILTLFCSAALAKTGDGGYAGPFLQLGFGARALGMGGAFVAVADDATGGFFNPAGLVQITKRTFGAFYRRMTLDRRLSYIVYNQPVRDEATIALAWINAGVADVMGRDGDGDITEEISNYQNAIQLFLGRRIINQLSIGVTIGYMQHNLANINAYGIGFGFSAMGRPIPELRLGVAVENLGMKYSWTSGDYWKRHDLLGSSVKENFPFNIRVGASYLLLEDRILLSSEFDKNEKQEGKIHLGVEGWALENVAGRIGYDRGSLTFGLGLKHKIQSAVLGFDYAFITSRVEDDADHLISLQFEF